MSRQRRTKSHKSQAPEREVRKDMSRVNTNKEPSTDGKNDPSWYNQSASLLLGAGSLNYTYPVGYNINMNVSKTSGIDIKYSVPGALLLKTRPTFGFSESVDDPINVAATAIYSFIRHANSGHANYDAPDLMVYLMAESEVFAYINWLTRLYAMSRFYIQENRYIPNSVIRAEGVDPSDLQTNGMMLNYGINMLIEKASALAVPKDMAIFYRRAFMFMNVYTEGESSKDQMYLYSPEGFLMFDDGTEYNNLGSNLIFEKVGNDKLGWKIENLLDYGNRMINKLLEQEDCGIMSGDILRAYGNDGIIKLNELPVYVPFAPVYQPEVLEQMKNALIVPAIYGTVNEQNDKFALYQDPKKKFLISRTAVATNSSPIGEVRRKLLNQMYILTTSKSDPKPEDNIVNTRLAVAGAWYNASLNEQYLYTGSEVVTSAHMLDASNDTDYVIKSYFTVANVAANAKFSMNAADLGNVMRLSSFKYHPRVQEWYYDTTGKSTNFIGMLFDVDNYTVLDTMAIQRMHETALMSMTAVPSIAKYSTISKK